MRTSLRGHPLPESFADFQALQADGKLQTAICCRCSTALSELNITSAAGWRGSQITGWCERCFDDVTSFPDDEEDAL